MELLKSPDYAYLLKASLQDLHRQNLERLSETQLWREEINFFQKLLERYSSQISSSEQRKKISHFQNLIIYYNGELLDQFTHDLKKHEKYLSRLLQDNESYSEESFRQTHIKLLDELKSFKKEFIEMKRNLFLFTESLME
ncbi:hypothetical protein AAG747_02435 [Rapidithrix thailandica]|uniref:Uncharacterized protein n=1 Tax=Rapidithrix thailandica TaxID=413964 RepID=A0AAW9S2Y5_9BACT